MVPIVQLGLRSPNEIMSITASVASNLMVLVAAILWVLWVQRQLFSARINANKLNIFLELSFQYLEKLVKKL